MKRYNELSKIHAQDNISLVSIDGSQVLQNDMFIDISVDTNYTLVIYRIEAPIPRLSPSTI